MKRWFVPIVAVAAAVGLMVAGCGQAAPAPTQAPAAPPKAAEPAKPAAPTQVPAAPTLAPVAAPTKAPAVAPTQPPAPQPAAAPAKKVEWPEKGKTISLIIPYGAGGTTDVAGRLLAAGLEKELGVPVQAVNKAGAGAQIGFTELANAKPDGYTIGYTVIPTAITTYLDPERKAVFTRKSFQTLAGHYSTPVSIVVKGDSPYKTMKDLMDDAKAKPEKIRAGSGGLMGAIHLGLLMLEKIGGLKFAIVQFDGSGPMTTALLGGHIESGGMTMYDPKGGQVRYLGLMDGEENAQHPGVKTLVSMGYKGNMASSGGISAPAGTPKEVVDILSAALKKIILSAEHKKKMDEMGQTIKYLDPDQYSTLWADMEKDIDPLMALAKR